MERQNKIIIVNETVRDSWMKDIFTFLTMMLPLYINHRLLGGHVILDIIFIVLVMFWWLNRNSPAIHEFDTVEEARDYINSTEVFDEND